MKQLTVLVTGASAGIGEATARKFYELGHTVLMVARRADRLSELSRTLGERAYPFPLDITDGPAVERFLQELPTELREIDVLVNNAGAAFGMAPAWEGSIDDWERMVDLNITSLLRLTKAVLPGMVQRDRGHIINLGSIAGTYPYPGGHVYGATKAFLQQFSMNLRCDLLGKRVRVTNIEPGLVETEFSLVRFGGDEKRAAAVYSDVESMLPEDIAETVAWCASMPARVNVNRVELMATMQTPGGLSFHRESKEN